MHNHDLDSLTANPAFGSALQTGGLASAPVTPEQEKAFAARIAEQQKAVAEYEVKREKEALQQVRLACLQTALQYHTKDTIDAIRAAKSYFDFITGAPRPEAVK